MREKQKLSGYKLTQILTGMKVRIEFIKFAFIGSLLGLLLLNMTAELQ